MGVVWAMDSGRWSFGRFAIGLVFVTEELFSVSLLKMLSLQFQFGKNSDEKMKSNNTLDKNLKKNQNLQK